MERRGRGCVLVSEPDLPFDDSLCDLLNSGVVNSDVHKSYYCPCVGYGTPPPPVHTIPLPSAYLITVRSQKSFQPQTKRRGRGRGRGKPLTPELDESKPSVLLPEVTDVSAIDPVVNTGVEYMNESVSCKVLNWLSQSTSARGPGETTGGGRTTGGGAEDYFAVDSCANRSSNFDRKLHASDIEIGDSYHDINARSFKQANIKNYVAFRDSFLNDSFDEGKEQNSSKPSPLSGLVGDKNAIPASQSNKYASPGKKNQKQNRRFNAGCDTRKATSLQKEDWKFQCNMRAAHQSGFTREDGDDGLIEKFKSIMEPMTVIQFLPSQTYYSSTINETEHAMNTVAASSVGDISHGESSNKPSECRTFEEEFPSLNTNPLHIPNDRTAGNTQGKRSSDLKSVRDLKSIASSLKS